MASSSFSSALPPPLITMVVLFLLSCFISTSFSLRVTSDHRSDTKPLGFTTRVIHRDSPESPFYDPKLTDADRLRNSIQRSFERYRYYTSNIIVPNSMRAPLSYRTFEYVISYRIGTPPVDTYAVIDTGSELTWLQCRPCDNCFDQEIPIFNPRDSTSYEKVGCEDDICNESNSSTCDEDGTYCLYKMEYADSGHSKGILSSESFMFLDDTRSGNITIPSFPFGCGHNNSFPYINATHPGAPGLIGLNKEPLSWIYQLSFEHFSHCFVPKTWINKTSLLHFGSDAIITQDTTPMVDHGMFTTRSYYVALEGISAGKTKLNIPKEAFLITAYGEGGVVIDTGTAYTHIVREAYDPLITELEKQITLEPVGPKGDFSNCYKGNTTADIIGMPDITFHFSGLNFVLSKWNIWLDVGDRNVCLTLLQSTEDLTLIGAQHLQNVNVGYDLEKKVISLLNKEDCTKT